MALLGRVVLRIGCAGVARTSCRGDLARCGDCGGGGMYGAVSVGSSDAIASRGVSGGVGAGPRRLGSEPGGGRLYLIVVPGGYVTSV